MRPGDPAPREDPAKLGAPVKHEDQARPEDLARHAVPVRQEVQVKHGDLVKLADPVNREVQVPREDPAKLTQRPVALVEAVDRKNLVKEVLREVDPRLSDLVLVLALVLDQSRQKRN